MMVTTPASALPSPRAPPDVLDHVAPQTLPRALSSSPSPFPCSGSVWQTRRTTPPPMLNPYKRHRFPAAIFSTCMWLYFRGCLSSRDGEEPRLERGVILPYEAVRSWCRQFGPSVCPSVASAASQTRRPVAPRGGLADHQWATPLPLVGGGSGRPRPGSPRVTAAGSASSQDVLSQTAEGLDLRASGISVIDALGGRAG